MEEPGTAVPRVQGESPILSPITMQPFQTVDPLLATAASPLQAQTALEQLNRTKARIANTIALILTIGFLALSLCVLLGFVNLTDPTASALAGSIIGFAVARLDPILTAYFGVSVSDIRQQSTAQVAGRQPDSDPRRTP